MKPDCETCKAKNDCHSCVDPGSIICMANRMQLGGNHSEVTTFRANKVDPGCAGCRYTGKAPNEMPCANCTRLSKQDWYEP